MDIDSICKGTVIIIFGVIAFAIYHFKVDWFMEHWKTQSAMDFFGDKGFVIFYTVTSLIIIGFGIAILLGGIDL